MRYAFLFSCMFLLVVSVFAQDNRTSSPQSSTAGATEIVLRCRPSLPVSDHALVVIDGKISSSDMKDVDVNAIASIAILKGDTAIALYGSRGVNGVICIKMKVAAQIFQIRDGEDGSGLNDATLTFVDDKKDSIRLLADQTGSAQTDRLKPGTEYSVYITVVGHKEFTAKYKALRGATTTYRLARDVKENPEVIVVGYGTIICRYWRRDTIAMASNADLLFASTLTVPSTVKVFPNPTRRGGKITVELNAADNSPRQIRIFNLNGAMLSSQVYVPVKGLNQINVPVASHWAGGMYTVQVADQRGQILQHKLLVN
ncbi:MAG: T9SS type A sorting domain-containing protein [Chitinophagaceae bacterium]